MGHARAEEDGKGHNKVRGLKRPRQTLRLVQLSKNVSPWMARFARIDSQIHANHLILANRFLEVPQKASSKRAPSEFT